MSISDKSNEKLLNELSEIKDQNKILKAEIEYLKNSLIYEEKSIGAFSFNNNKFKYVSDGLCNIFGYSRDKLIGKSPAIIIHPTDRNFFSENIQHTSASRSSITKFEIKGLCKNGDTKDILIINEGYTNENPTTLVGKLVDITDVKHNKDRLNSVLFRAVEQSHASILLTDRSGNIEFVNDRFCSQTGYSRGEIVGKNPKILKSGQTSNEEYKHLWETIISGKCWSGEFTNQKKDGGTYVESASITPIANDQGLITHFLAIEKDISALKKANAQIQTLSAVVEENPLMVLITNERYEIQYINKQFSIFTQYSIDEIRGRISWIFNPKHIEWETYAKMMETLGKGEVWQNESVNRKKDGSRFYEKTKVFPLLNTQNAITNYIIISEDITREKQILDDLIKAKEQAEKSELNLRNAQNEILRSQKLLQEVETISKVGGWEYNVETKQSFWTPEVYRIYEIDTGKKIDHLKFSLKYFSAKDTKRVCSINCVRGVIIEHSFCLQK